MKVIAIILAIIGVFVTIFYFIPIGLGVIQLIGKILWAIIA